MNLHGAPSNPHGSSMIEMVQLPDSSWRFADTSSDGGTHAHIAKLYLSESLDTLIEQFLGTVGLSLPPNFLQTHTKNTMGAWQAPLLGKSEMTFFGKWATPVTQFREQWDIEQRIAINKPYDTDTARDPSELRLDHVRYERDPLFPVRPYHPISSLASGQDEVPHAATECVSMYFKSINGVKTGMYALG